LFTRCDWLALSQTDVNRELMLGQWTRLKEAHLIWWDAWARLKETHLIGGMFGHV